MLIQWLLIRTEKKTSLVHCKHWNELLTKRFAKFLLIAMGMTMVTISGRERYALNLIQNV